MALCGRGTVSYWGQLTLPGRVVRPYGEVVHCTAVQVVVDQTHSVTGGKCTAMLPLFLRRRKLHRTLRELYKHDLCIRCSEYIHVHSTLLFLFSLI